MNDLSVYIANLGKYNEGELVGAWFTLPVSFEDVKEKIGLNDQYEEYAIHDYELPVKISEYTSIDELNEITQQLEELADSPIYSVIDEIIGDWFQTLEELIEHKDDIIFHSSCDSMEDVARYYIEETGSLGEVPSHLQSYIDYEAYGRDLEMNGNFIIASNGIFEY